MSGVWQPRWAAYAAANGRTPDEQAAHDTHGGRYMAWVDTAWAAWCAETGRPRHGLTGGDHQAFDAWLPSYQTVNSTAAREDQSRAANGPTHKPGRQEP